MKIGLSQKLDTFPVRDFVRPRFFVSICLIGRLKLRFLSF